MHTMTSLLKKMKQEEKLVMLTAYDYPSAKLAEAAGVENTVVIYIKVDAKGRFGGSGAWWDVPVSEVSEVESTQQARKEYEEQITEQRLYL